MSKKVRKALVNCLDYNGHKNVLFMMKEDDFRFNDGNYQLIEFGEYSKSVFTGVSGAQYKVFPDWSVLKIE